jgi:hypothetical protein
MSVIPAPPLAPRGHNPAVTLVRPTGCRFVAPASCRPPAPTLMPGPTSFSPHAPPLQPDPSWAQSPILADRCPPPPLPQAAGARPSLRRATCLTRPDPPPPLKSMWRCPLEPRLSSPSLQRPFKGRCTPPRSEPFSAPLIFAHAQAPPQPPPAACPLPAAVGALRRWITAAPEPLPPRYAIARARPHPCEVAQRERRFTSVLRPLISLGLAARVGAGSRATVATRRVVTTASSTSCAQAGAAWAVRLIVGQAVACVGPKAMGHASAEALGWNVT